MQKKAEAERVEMQKKAEAERVEMQKKAEAEKAEMQKKAEAEKEEIQKKAEAEKAKLIRSEEKESLEKFKENVRKQQFIGLVNMTDRKMTFTSKRLLMERLQVVDARSRVSIDWAYKNLGLISSTGNPNVTVSCQEYEKLACLDGGQTLIVKADGSFEIE